MQRARTRVHYYMRRAYALHIPYQYNMLQVLCRAVCCMHETIFYFRTYKTLDAIKNWCMMMTNDQVV